MERCLYTASILCVVIGLAFTVFVAAKSPARYVWDEWTNIKTARKLRAEGLTREYFRGVYVSVGPVFYVLHASLAPWTNFLERNTRMVSTLFLTLSLLTAAWALASLGSVRPLIALELFFLPILPLVGGLAMTDILSIFFSILYVALLVRALRTTRMSGFDLP